MIKIHQANKCRFGQSELDFLGHHIDRNGITPLQDKVQAVREFPQPQSQRKLRQFTWIDDNPMLAESFEHEPYVLLVLFLSYTGNEKVVYV